MGYMKHHAIIVTGTDHGGSAIQIAHKEAKRIFPWVSAISPPAVNTYRTFLIPPDGSKEGWEESDEGDARRAEFIAHLKTLAYDDGSSPLDWAEISYADDYGPPQVTDSSTRKKE